ncbi:MAG TPA: nuclease [Gammaproteobacteria bacterium]|nr:nuclease [Gammaproteobacteria bacterium]MEC8011243.1 thermonuclease family protein [Pseudomonadota bacterium]HBF06990.1 nuclease [Gammaproteobacteria bacterium]HCK94078.1 nuclease [Gammaproteobacteria bacterium]|tara:strand:+ start:17822 stop:18262 length:441 start_codon:yes stop_codon:yes gene_type:complete
MRYIYLLASILFFSACTLDQQKQNQDEVIIKQIVSVYDADTFRAALKDWPEYLGNDVGIRIRGIDAPEIRGKCPQEKTDAIKARDYVRQRLANADHIRLENIETGKYFRLVADVYVDGHNLAETLVQLHYARPYDGGQRKGWCPIS